MSKKVPCHCDKCRGRHVSKRIEREHCSGQEQQEKSTGQKRQRTDSGVDNENSGSKKKPKDGHPTISFFEQAKSLFPLDKRAKAATERGWETYIANRVAAEKEFPGPKEPVAGEDDVEDEYDPRAGEPDFIYALNLMRCRLASLENEMELDKGVLLKSFRVLDCSPEFEDEDEPRAVTTLTRIYSPTQPVYIDVHFVYDCRPRRAWGYSLKFKIYSPETNDHKIPKTYSGNGWKSIACGSYSHYYRPGKKWVKIEDSALDLGEDDAKQVYEALWGCLDDIRGDDENKREMDRRSKMVDAVRVLLAAVGIGYDIAISDDGEDDACDVYMLEGLSDRWFARGVRKACGFQLKNDLKNEKKRLTEREKAVNRAEEDRAEKDDPNDDEGGMSDEGDLEDD